MQTISEKPLVLKRVLVRDYLSLTKPRVMILSIFTALCGMIIAPSCVPASHMLGILMAISMAAGACGTLNMWYERTSDAKMERTQRRPIPQGRIQPNEAFLFGILLLGLSIGLMAYLSNILATALLFFTVFFYIVIYTMWLKPTTSHNIVIGGLSGALPPLVGWTAMGDPVSLMPLLMVLIIFIWTPAHFWALALSYVREYRQADLPMLPVVVGEKVTCRYIFIYSALTVASSLLPWMTNNLGILYATYALISGLVFMLLAWRVLRQEKKSSRELFGYSILYLLLLFLMMLIDCEISRKASCMARFLQG